ncbi:hypothetical protein B0H13DRAFT_1987012, partial [Mycena leptocephala]
RSSSPFFFSFRAFAFISELDSVCLPPMTHLESYTGSHIVSDQLDGSPSHRPPIINYARSSLEWRFPTLVSSTCPQCVIPFPVHIRDRPNKGPFTRVDQHTTFDFNGILAPRKMSCVHAFTGKR